MVLLVVTADNHLGQYAARMPFARLEERRRRLRDGFRRAVSYAVQRRAAAFLHAGDLFDTVDPRNLERVMVSQELARLQAAGITVVGIGGNHDTPRHTGQHGGYHAADIYASLGGLHFCTDSEAVTSVVVEREGLTIQLGGVSWNSALGPEDDPLADLAYPDPETGRADWKVLLAHVSPEGHRHPEAQEPYVRRQTIAELDADVLVLGHEHRRTFMEIEGRKVLVPGATELMRYGEFGHAPGFASIELGHRGMFRHRWHPFPAQPRLRLTVRANELIAAPAGLRDPDDSVTEVVVRRVREASHPDQLTTLVLEGELPRDRYMELDFARVQDVGVVNNFFFSINTDDLHLANEFGVATANAVRLSQRQEVEAAIRDLEPTTDEERAAVERCRERILAYYGGMEDE